MTARLSAAVIVATTIMWVSSADANPDVWVTASVTYRMQDSKVSAITFEWRFDEYFSDRTIRTFDANRNGILEPDEANRLRAEAFDPLKKFDYHVHVWAGDKKLKNHRIEDFSVRLDGKVMVYRFTVPLSPAVDAKAAPLIASLDDKDIVIDFQYYKQRFVLVQGTMEPDCKFKVARGTGAQSRHARPVTLKCGGST